MSQPSTGWSDSPRSPRWRLPSRGSPATPSAPATSTRRWSKRKSARKPRRMALRAIRSSATCCSRSSRTSGSRRLRSWVRSRSSSRARRRHRSLASPCRSMAAGPRIERGCQASIQSREEKVNKVLDAKDTQLMADATEQVACTQEPAQKRRQIVLVFQGGGALGAYQAGVYQALHEGNIEPDWIIGTSIGAINASLIAGNEPGSRLDRLEEFWRRMRRNELGTPWSWRGLSDTTAYWSTVLSGIPGFFEPNPFAFLGAHYPLGRDKAGF